MQFLGELISALQQQQKQIHQGGGRGGGRERGREGGREGERGGGREEGERVVWFAMSRGTDLSSTAAAAETATPGRR